MAMASRTKTHVLKGGHTAGIFADMSVDGPEIGTLVAVVDRAKNLPNRKTIGKQDPYCAARLGKEAKKTNTDVRGGQTPKWDQELRFVVYDSADYYQLKISVFTDDKKTDLIGEAWIDLKGIVVAGGGQNDVWQTLSCRGKYAGEIRLEITYYDSRPKPEKPAARSKQPTPSEQESTTGSLRSRGPRPLPSDPVTGESPVAPSPDPQYQTPPRAHAKNHSHAGFIPKQSPLQAVEYNTPPPAAQPSIDHYSPSPRAGGSPSHYTPSRPDAHHQAPPRMRDPYEMSGPQHAGGDVYQRSPPSAYDSHDSWEQAPPQPEYYEPQPPRDSMRPGYSSQPEQAPPPPMHRARHNSGSQDLSQKPQALPMRHDVLKSEAHRQSMPTYPGRPTFRPYEGAAASASSGNLPNTMSYEPPPQRHYSHDAAADDHYRSMQPTVEDVPDSPGNASPYRHSTSRSYHGQGDYETATMPPQNFNRGPGGYSPGYGTSPPALDHRDHHEAQDNQGYPYSTSPGTARTYSESPAQMSSHQRQSRPQQYGYRADSEPRQIQSSRSYGMPDLPSSLVPGVDHALSQDISNHIYEERRHDDRLAGRNSAPMPRGRHMSEPPSTEPYSNGRSPGHSPGYAPQIHDRPTFSSHQRGSDPRMSRSVNVSPGSAPAPSHTIKRKSVSPSPAAAEQRRLSDIPFGPDSYDALNPSLVSSASAPEHRDPDAKIITHDGREIDPSDHLPMDSWAPEPEPKPASQAPQPEARSRPAPAGAQPMPSAGRRPLRVARPQPAPVSIPTYSSPQPEPYTPPAPASGGRNRLQKKTPRGSAGPSPAMSSPLAPISPDNYRERQSPYTPSRGHQRHNTWDYPSENHAPHYGHGPPIPAKVPMMSGGNGADAALMEEMARIDIGAGRSRRRGGY